MKKIILLMLLSIASSSSFARTCPPVDKLFVKTSKGYEVSPPSGWVTVNDTRSWLYNDVTFSVAAWGDHKHTTDNVRCYYYKNGSGSEFVKIETTDLMDASHVSAWGGNDPLYYLCSRSTDVKSCPFV